MPRPHQKSGIQVFLICAFLAGLAPGVQEAGLSGWGKDHYIEVNVPGIPYVPMTAEYVKVDGQVRKIARFAATLSAGEDECPCPKCCKGYCYIIIFTDVMSIGGPIRTLYVLCIEC